MAVHSFFGEHADGAEHFGVGHGAEDVVPPEARVEGNGLRELRDVRTDIVRKNVPLRENRRFFLHRHGIVVTQRWMEAKTQVASLDTSHPFIHVAAG